MENIIRFSDLGLSKTILHAINEKGFETPSPIQETAIPLIIKGDKDLVGKAQTGSGKTAAFGLPILDLLEERAKHVQAVILAPTRELAVQISDELNSFKGSKRLSIVPIYGGQSIDRQLEKIAMGVDVVVGTTGRVLDLLRRKSVNFNNIKFLVLDEADEMLNMGFLEEVEEILRVTNKTKRTFMFCATMPDEIGRLASNYMKEYDTIKIENKQKTTDLTDQIYIEVEESDKFEALCRIIDFEQDFYGLVFTATKSDADHISAKLSDRGYEADCLHGDISQTQREKILKRFKAQKLKVLVATDVAARGIDVNNLTHVVNYALPRDVESYIHRVGRTGRAGAEGNAITFVTRRESRHLNFIKKASKTDIRKETLPTINDIILSNRMRIKNQLDEIMTEKVEKHYKTVAKDLLREHDPLDVIAAILKMNMSNDLDPGSYKEINQKPVDGRTPTRLFIALGKKDGMTKKSIVLLITEKAKTYERKITDVQVFDEYSFITAPFHEAEYILKAFRNEKRGKKPMVEKAGD